jgi:anti-sigma regulatory factor (Ser/Thr protein kinase)
MELKLSIPGDIRAAETARRAVDAFRPHVPEGRLEVLELLVNELVTNALLHSCMEGDSIAVDVHLVGGRIRGEVCDPGTGFERPGAPALDATSGRGLMLVDALAESWGIISDPSTCVWFELAAEASIPSARSSVLG